MQSSKISVRCAVTTSVVVTWIVLGFVALHFFLPFWLETELGNLKSKVTRTDGLYLGCDSGGTNETRCEWARSDRDENSYHALWSCRILWLAGNVLMLIIAISTCFLFGETFRSRSCVIGLIVTTFITTALLVASAVVYGIVVRDDDHTLLWGYYLACVSTLLPLVVALIFVCYRSQLQYKPVPKPSPPRSKESSC